MPVRRQRLSGSRGASTQQGKVGNWHKVYIQQEKASLILTCASAAALLLLTAAGNEGKN